uniref:Superoxide dismutase copper chaperone n=1 Tax=Sus scrofa TaxID=9823 RepID=A0A8D1DS82_PIG
MGTPIKNIFKRINLYFKSGFRTCFGPQVLPSAPSLLPGIQSVEVQLENQMVLVQTTLPSQVVQALLEDTGRQAVLKGMGSGRWQNLEAAVAILGGSGPVQGVVRFLQLTPERCLIEGTIDGLKPGLHGLHVHQFGDLTRNCNSCGDHFNPDGMSHGGPQDPDRVSVGLGEPWAERGPRVSEAGQAALGSREYSRSGEFLLWLSGLR